MPPTRREFIQSAALALAALALARCKPGLWVADDTPRGRLRACWLWLGSLAQETRQDYERAEKTRDQLLLDHQSALRDLVTAGTLTPAVSEPVQEAYVEASYHVWRSNAPITCYEPVMVDYTPTSADQLVKQVDLLAEMAERGDLNPETVARARAAIERDMAFLALSDPEVEALYERLKQAGGDSYSFPTFEQLELDIPPDVIAAARFLVDLLLEA
ncbi:MAG: hypothetical protein KKA73_24215 [Chloroflexi bacterium]|nr:hypothetical protein [Chloroflexota bacterium]MBU1750798.1 hypothetical protein [Chloroflexota bacterium]